MKLYNGRMNLKDAVETGGSAFADHASIQMELDRNRKKGDLLTYILRLEIFDSKTFHEVWKLLTDQERAEYKALWNVINDFFACRYEFSKQDGELRSVAKDARYEKFFRLLKSYEANGKTLELKIALDSMMPDEKESYAMRSRSAAQ